MKFSDNELELIETSLRGTLSRLGINEEIEKLIDKIVEGNEETTDLLTTGQIMDQLKVGQVAERIFEPIGVCSDAYTKVKLDDDGDLMFYVEHDKNWSYERLTGNVIQSNWMIIKGKGD